jgi:Reverse transcriptase (RNA-dependent DNA polymerase)
MPSSLNIVSFNMHGFNQGMPVLNDLIVDYDCPDVLLVQEHWLTPDNLAKLNCFEGYFVYASSPMLSVVESGPLFGRPFGGIGIIVKEMHRSACKLVCSGDRFVAITLHEWLIINVYFPSSGTVDRRLIAEQLLDDICSCRESLLDHTCLLAGDFNIDLGNIKNDTRFFCDFIRDRRLYNCYDLYPNRTFVSYINEALGQVSLLDYFFVSDPSTVLDICTLDPDVNFSDHLPIMVSVSLSNNSNITKTRRSSSVNSLPRLRWDHADLVRYYDLTRVHLEPILTEVDFYYENRQFIGYSDSIVAIERIFRTLVNVFSSAAHCLVPVVSKNAHKFWWSCQMAQLKSESIDSNTLWISAGRPRSGPVFLRRQSSRSVYRRELKRNQEYFKNYYSDSLHESLLRKNGTSFWKCWRSKFETRSSNLSISGSVDDEFVSNKFYDHFSGVVSPNSVGRNAELRQAFESSIGDYLSSHDYGADNLFDIEAISDAISGLKRGKAAGPDGLCAEHLLNSHPILASILLRLFNLLVYHSFVPSGFFASYTIPLLKVKDYLSKSLECSDFRGIAISNIFSKCFEYCLMSKFASYLDTTDSQFGFKQSMGCGEAIFTARRVIESYVDGGDTAHVCALDISKAFDKVNHYGLFLKLMKRNIPSSFLGLLVNWLPYCFTCIKWRGCYSPSFQLSVGIRQGSVLAPILFSVYVDDIMRNSVGLRYGEIIMYADDILIITRSIAGLQHMLNVVEIELTWLDMRLNGTKSVVIFFQVVALSVR